MRIFLLFSITLILFSKLSAFSETINIAWDPWCPWMCESNDKPGFSTELVEEVFKYSNIKVQFEKYSWPAAIRESREGRSAALLAPAKKETPDFIFSKSYVAFQQMCFFVNNDFNWTYKNIDSLKNISIAVSQGVNYPGLMEYIHNNSDKVRIISTENVYTIGFTNLKENKYNSFLTDNFPSKYYLNKNKLNKLFKKVGCLEKEKLYLGFSPKNKYKSLRLSNIFEHNLKLFKKSNEFDVLLKKYDIRRSDLD